MLIRISRKKMSLNSSMFKFFCSTPMNMVFPLLKSCFLLYPFYCPLTPHFSFSLEIAPASQVIPSNKNASEPTLLWGTGHYYCRGVINLSSLSSPSCAISCLQIKIISCELQNISGNTVIKIKSVVIFINITFIIIIIIIIIAIATVRPRLHSHQSDAPQYIKTLDSTALRCFTQAVRGFRCCCASGSDLKASGDWCLRHPSSSVTSAAR
jgi:hypothetical protein